MQSERKAGILLPITALPGKYGIGTLGKNAYSFLDFLFKSGIKIWQILPIGPIGYGNSPYQSLSSFAGNEYLIDLVLLQNDGLLTEEECNSVDFGNSASRINYGALFENRKKILFKAFKRFDINTPEFVLFGKNEEIYDYAIFSAIKEKNGYKPWYEWERGLRDGIPCELKEYCNQNRESVDFYLFMQYIFFKQYGKLKSYASSKGIKIFGDMPLYPSLDSVDVWKHREIFQLDEQGLPKSVAGVPPDAFSNDGQMWGNPLFDWDELKKHNYDWWNKRISRAFDLFDIVRIDHFRGFDRYYSIPRESKNAINGCWRDGPKFDFFTDKTDLDIVAEDLGIIDDGVRLLLSQTGFPGMKVLLFAFDGNSDNPYLPSNINKNSVVYTGTHDNLPIMAYLKTLDTNALERLKMILKKECKALNISMRASAFRGLTIKIIETAFASIADTVIVPLCDLLCLGDEARINFPSTLSQNNWSYRFSEKNFSTSLSKRLSTLVKRYNR